MKNSIEKNKMNKLFWTVFVFSFAIIAAAPSQEAKNQGKLLEQSFCTLSSNLSGQPDIFSGSETLKIWGAKNRVHPAFHTPYFGPDHKPTQVFKWRIVGAGWPGNFVKGQKISEGNCGGFNFQKTSVISAQASKKWSNQKIKGTLLP